MKKFTKVCLIFALVLVCLGTVACITGVVMGAGSQNLQEAWKNGDLQLWGWNVGESGIGWINDEKTWDKGKQTVDTFDVKDVKELNIYLKYGILHIESSDTDEIVVEVENNNGYFETTLKNGMLKLEDTRNSGINSKGYKIRLSIPSDMELDRIKIENNAGTLESDGVSLSADKVDIKVDAGETYLKQITADDFRMEVGAGNADIIGLAGKDINIDCGVGNIDVVLAGKEQDYNYNIDCGVGNIDINHESYSALGKSKEIHNGAANDVSLSCGVGNITIETE